MAIQPRSRSESGGSSKKPISISSGSEVGGSDIDPNFRSIVIYVYRNGDEFDKGVEVTITRKAFKHWLNLLEYLTKRCNTTKPVNFIYKLTGEAIKGFKQLEDGGEYVAASGPFKSCRYRSKAKKDFKVDPHQIRRKDPPALDSSESLEMFLRRTGYHKGKDAKYPEDIFEDTSLDLRSKNTSRLPSQKNGNGPPSSIGSSIVKPTAVRPPIATINNPKVTDAKFGRNAGVMDKYLTNQPQIPHRNLSQLRSFSDEGSHRPSHVDSRRSSEYEDRLYRTLPSDNRGLGRSPLAQGFYTPPPAHRDPYGGDPRGYYSRESDPYRNTIDFDRHRADYDDRFYQRPPPNYPRTPVELDEITRRLNFLESKLATRSQQPYDDRYDRDRDLRGMEPRRELTDYQRAPRSNVDEHSRKASNGQLPKAESLPTMPNGHSNETAKPTPKPTVVVEKVKTKPSSPKFRLPTRENTIDDSSSFANLKILLNDNRDEKPKSH